MSCCRIAGRQRLRLGSSSWHGVLRPEALAPGVEGTLFQALLAPESSDRLECGFLVTAAFRVVYLFVALEAGSRRIGWFF